MDVRSEGARWRWLLAGALSVSAGAAVTPKRSALSPTTPAGVSVSACTRAEALLESSEPGAPSRGATHALELLADHLGMDEASREKARAERGLRGLAALDARRLFWSVKKRARDRHVTAKFVITLMPDYVDSNSAWMFDSYLDAVQRAAGAAGYVLDRFHLPDWAPEKGTGASGPERRTHEAEPAVILFRDSRPEKTNGKAARDSDVLVVLVPTETATSGVHAEAFLSAAALASAWSPREPLLVLGPSFSGSTPSLVRVLDEAQRRRALPRPDAGEPAVRIVAGSASALRNKTLLENARVGVEFHSTSVSDQDYLVALRDYLGGLDQGWAVGERMALLIEGNTGWGQGLSSDRTQVRPDEVRPDAQLAKRDCRAGRRVFPCAQLLTFPLHISRLRGVAAARGRGTGDADPYSSAVSLPLEEQLPPRDRIPPLTPGITGALTETTLERLLDSLERLRVSAVGIYATDKRDHLFLAQEITRRSPNVLLFALESSLIYLHPDFRPYLRGTLVASPSPLFNLTQVLAGRPNARRMYQFPSSDSATVYNAFLALLEKPERMLDYGAGCGPADQDRLRNCAPSVWLGVVGREDVWPLSRARPVPSVNRGYSWPGRKGALYNPASPRLPVPGPATVAEWPQGTASVMAGLALVLLAHGAIAVGILAALAGHGRLRVALPALEPPRARARRLRAARTAADGRFRAAQDPREAVLGQEYALALLACGGALWAMTTWLGGVAEAGRGTLESGDLGWLITLVRWLGTGRRCEALGAAIAVGAVAALWPTAARRRGEPGSLALIRVAPVAAGLLAMFELRSVFTDPDSVFAGELRGLNAFRAASLSSFVSPSPAVLLLSAVAYVWGVFNLRRVHLQAVSFLPDSPVLELMSGGHRTVKENLGEALNHLRLRSCSACSLALLPFVGAPLVLGSRLGHSLDGRPMGEFLTWGTAFAFMLMGHATVHCARLGSSLLAGLRSLNLHPLGAAFARVAGEPFVWHPSLKVPDGRMLSPLVRQAGAVVAALGGPSRESAATELVDTETFAREVCACDPLQATRTWAKLERFADPLSRILELGAWAQRPYPTERADPPDWQREAETFLALQVACTLRQGLARLLSGLSLALVGLAFILAAHLFYVFQGRSFWLTVDWVYLGLGAALAVLLLVRLEKDAVLSRLWSTDPGRVDWGGAFVKRMVVYGALPVVTLFATFFPEVGRSLFAWIEPVKRVLP